MSGILINISYNVMYFHFKLNKRPLLSVIVCIPDYYVHQVITHGEKFKRSMFGMAAK